MGSESLSQSNKLVQKHEIRWRETGSWFNTDDDLADRAFRAAVEFLTETGIYCTSTNRVIHFTEDEVLDAIREAPEQVHMGEGRDARVFKQQALEGRTALNFCPGHHAPFTEELAPLVVKNMAGMNRNVISSSRRRNQRTSLILLVPIMLEYKRIQLLTG